MNRDIHVHLSPKHFHHCFVEIFQFNRFFKVGEEYLLKAIGTAGYLCKAKIIDIEVKQKKDLTDADKYFLYGCHLEICDEILLHYNFMDDDEDIMLVKFLNLKNAVF